MVPRISATFRSFHRLPPSSRSMPPARGQALAKAPTLKPSTPRGRSRGPPLTSTSCFTASCDQGWHHHHIRCTRRGDRPWRRHLCRVGDRTCQPSDDQPGRGNHGNICGRKFRDSRFLRASDGTLTTFDAPSAVNGTNGQAINPKRLILGFYNDASFVAHGFLREPDGTITTFDAPGAVNGTVPSSLNPKGAVTGQSFDAGFNAHGFARTPHGNVIGFDPPGSTDTEPIDINPAGAVTGSYLDASSVWHGFLRHPDGSIITVDIPDAGRGTFQGTI